MLALLGPVAGCSSINDAIDSDRECVDSFLEAVGVDDELRPLAENESAWGSYQGEKDWEGGTPVCWVNYSGSGTCTGFMYDLEGRWAPAAWVLSTTETSRACAREQGGNGIEFE